MTDTKTGTVTAADAKRETGATPREAHAYSLGHGAVLHAIEKNATKVELPGLGVVRLPSPDALAWYGGLITLTAVGVMEWPVAVAIGMGHLLAQAHHHRLLRDFGEALEEA